MSIPTPFNPLGTLGAEPPLPPGFAPLPYVTTTKDLNPQGIPWPKLRIAAYDPSVDTLRIVAGATDKTRGYGRFFAYNTINNYFFGAMWYGAGNSFRLSNGGVEFYSSVPVGELVESIIAPDRLSVGAVSVERRFTQRDMTTLSYTVSYSNVMLARISRLRLGHAEETVVAARRLEDGAQGLVSIYTGVFWKA